MGDKATWSNNVYIGVAVQMDSYYW